MSVRPRMYWLYGLRVMSVLSLPCPEYIHNGVPPDVELLEDARAETWEPRDQDRRSYSDDGFWHCTVFQDDSAHVCWRDHFEFLVSRDGLQVRWRKLRDVPDEVLSIYLMGQVLSFCLLRRGIEPLHATAIVVQ